VPEELKAALAIVPATLCGMVAFLVSFAVSGAIWFNLGAALLAFAACLWLLTRHSERQTTIVAASSLCLLGIVIAPNVLDRLRGRPAPEPGDLVQKIGAAAIPLQSVDAGSGFADLAPIGKIWQGVRVVALGEATHGTSEFFRMKHRMTEFLVTQMGFRHFAMEINEDEARLIDEYIQGKRDGNPVNNLSWPWKTREVSDMVDWMRRYNQPAKVVDRVHFHGFDFQGDRRDFRMAQNVLSLLDRLGAESRLVLWAHNAHVSSGAGWMGSYLKHQLLNQIYLTGFEFHHGRFTSNMNWVRTYEAEPAVDGFYAAAVARAGQPILVLDFRTMERDAALDAWLHQPRLAHELQEIHGLLRLNPKWVRTNESWPSLFDGVIYIEASTPAHLL
jgi:erythromycin esterase-like protein